jgi:acyl-coenzyme A synthetase/AMP-(fatty) acid ligase
VCPTVTRLAELKRWVADSDATACLTCEQTTHAACRDVRKHIGAFAAPDVIHWAPGLPKTRSGKIMRRILRKIATNEYDQLGDISTLADSSIVESLIEGRPPL